MSPAKLPLSLAQWERWNRGLDSLCAAVGGMAAQGVACVY